LYTIREWSQEQNGLGKSEIDLKPTMKINEIFLFEVLDRRVL